ncbi:hypothetical protein LX87_04772 [Larkinella arboricola]|uniref:Uncharacterized protein n=1 Tax=Larkinella arboricola TaxID=643671 RepID=A0A327WVX9_LARAB|nr:hypothetical protein LX87_04772 [Larkinella arboricola]
MPRIKANFSIYAKKRLHAMIAYAIIAETAFELCLIYSGLLF